MNKILTLALFLTPTLAVAQVPPSPDAPPSARAYQGGVGSPFSSRASNIGQSDTRSEIAPRLPAPDAAGDDARSLLAAADRALARNQTGAAQEALERAETRVLTRSTDPAMANRPDTATMARGIADARTALGQHDSARARAAIQRVLNRG